MKTKYVLKRVLLLSCLLSFRLSAQLNCEWTAGMITDITGNMRLEINGNWSNQGLLLPGLSTIDLVGPYTQSLQQASGGFYNLTINKSASTVMLNSNILIQGGLIHVIQQDMVLNGYDMVLDPAATLQETPGHTITGGTGRITTTRTLTAPNTLNIAGMGLVITAEHDLGMATINRGHGAQTANGDEGISRYFDLVPQYDHVLESMAFLYDESELNGNDEQSLQLFYSPDGGINWIAVESVANSSANSVEAVDVMASGRYTLSSHCLETCIATVANTKPATLYLNAAGLAFLSPQQIDDNSRGACGVDTMSVSPEVFSCAAIGMQEVAFTVTDNHGCAKSAVANISVIDTVRPEMHCKSYTLYLDASCQGALTPMDIDDGSMDACGVSLSIDLASFDCDDIGQHQVTLTGFDMSGNTAQCQATVDVQMELPVPTCEDAFLDMGANGALVIDPFDLITGDPDDYEGFSFVVEPSILYCDLLGEHLVTVTITDPFGNITTCEATVHLTGPDDDCDNVSDACDQCHGGNDQADEDSDGIPDCSDWSGWNDLPAEWQCAANKVFLCHGGNVICVNQNAVQAHLDHGDFLGSCSAAYCENVPVQQSVDLQALDHGDILPVDHEYVYPDMPQGGSMQDVVLENQPNPFYPVTVIRFYMPADDRIVLRVFDITGRPVVVLMQGTVSAGWHEMPFDGTGRANGVYVCQLQTDQHRLARCMVLSQR